MTALEPLLNLMSPLIYGGVLILIRLFVCLQMMPEFGTGYLPRRSRLLIALLITVALYSGLGLPTVALPEFLPNILIHLAREVLFGAALGLAVRLVTATCQMAGDLIGLSMGLSMSTFFDMTSGEAPLAMGRLFGLVATMLFLALGGHLVVAGALFEHLSAHPAGELAIAIPSLEALAETGLHMFETALLLASPVIVVALLLNVAMAFVMRVVPSMNIFNIGIGILLIGGFFALSLEGHALVVLIGHELDALPSRMLNLAGGR
jgi:flagellar biosynthetic protein FliR